MSVRLSAVGGFVFAFVLGALLLMSVAYAAAQTTGTTPASCDQLYGLPQGTITTTASSAYLNSQTCAAYQYLIARYTPGPCSQVGFSNAKVQGITSLNTTFAQNLTNMLQAASAAGYNITINSAFRTVKGEQCANPGGFAGNSSASMHTKGLAADLQYPNDPNSAGGCDSGNTSAAYKWVAANAKNYGLGLYDQLHSHVKGECNHVEATSSSGGVGPGGGGTTTTTPAPTTTTASPPLVYTNPQQLNTQGCYSSLNPLVYSPPGYVQQSQCVAYVQQTLPYAPQTQSPYQAPIAQPAQAIAQPIQTTPVTTATSPTIATSPSTISTSPTLQPSTAATNALSNFLQPTATPSFTSASPASSALQQFTSLPATFAALGTATPLTASGLLSPTGTGTLASSSTLTTIRTIIASTIASSVAQTTVPPTTFSTLTFSSSSSSSAPVYEQGSPLVQVLNNIRTELANLLGFL